MSYAAICRPAILAEAPEMSYAASHAGWAAGGRAQAGGMLALRSKKLVGSQTVLVARNRSHCVGL